MDFTASKMLKNILIKRLNLKITHEYCGRINEDIFSQEKLIPPSVDTSISLTSHFTFNIQS